MGVDSTHIDSSSLEVPVHTDAISAFIVLKEDAQREGFNISLASGYRSFEQQLAIWNQKASGGRALLDADGKAIEYSRLNKRELMYAILRWSALPGSSRHHWGTDVDIYDANSLGERESLQLTVAETQTGGVFEHLYRWLDEYLNKNSERFFRPYAEDLGGIAPEPWHLSYKPLSSQYEEKICKEKLRQLIVDTNISLKNEILEDFDAIFERYIFT